MAIQQDIAEIEARLDGPQIYNRFSQRQIGPVVEQLLRRVRELEIRQRWGDE